MGMCCNSSAIPNLSGAVVCLAVCDLNFQEGAEAAPFAHIIVTPGHWLTAS